MPNARCGITADRAESSEPPGLARSAESLEEALCPGNTGRGLAAQAMECEPAAGTNRGGLATVAIEGLEKPTTAR